MNLSLINKNIDKIIIGLAVTQKRIDVMNGSIFEGGENEMEIISEDVYYLFAENKVVVNYTSSPWFRKL